MQAAVGDMIRGIALAPVECRFHKFVAMNSYDTAPKGHTYSNTLVCIRTGDGAEGVGVMGYASPDAAFLQALPQAVEVMNFWIGIGKSVAFGFAVAFVACHYGLRVLPNTDSLAVGVTRSVVAAITCVIILDAIFAVMLVMSKGVAGVSGDDTCIAQ